MAEAFIPSDNPEPRTRPDVRVYTRQRWFDSWTLQPDVYADLCRFSVAPQMPQAMLFYRYGRGKQIADDDIENHPALDIIGHYVKIEIDQDNEVVSGEDPTRWVGTIVDSRETIHGTLTIDETPVPAGTQPLHAVGLEHFFLRTLIDTSWVQDLAGDPYEVHRGLIFNDPADGNRHATDNQFAGGDVTPTTWTYANILQYLHDNHMPVDASDFASLEINLPQASLDILPDGDAPPLRPHGRTLYDVLNELIDRRPGLAWFLEYDEAANAANLRVVSFLAELVVLPSGAVLDANDDTIALDLDMAVDGGLSITRDDRHVVEQVIVRGDRKKSTVSLAFDDGTLETDWEASDETAYEAGPGGSDPDPFDLETFRSSDQYEHVFKRFRLPADWDGQVGDGEGGGNTVAFPNDPDFGPETFYTRGLRLGRTIPAGTITVDKLPAFVALKHDGTNWRYSNDLGGDQTGSFSVRVRTDAPGVILKAAGLKQHDIGGPQFANSLGPDEDALFDWKDLIVVATLEADSHVEQSYPLPGALEPLSDVVRRVVVDVGDRGQLHYTHAGATIFITDGVLVKAITGVYTRDDREWMLDLARRAFEWYGTPRSSVRMMFAQTGRFASIGQLVTTIGSVANATEETVNSLVTAVDYNLQRSSQRIETDYPDLDFRQL